MELRMRTKLTGKRTWFKKKKMRKDWYKEDKGARSRRGTD